jgi:ComF family protein
LEIKRLGNEPLALALGEMLAEAFFQQLVEDIPDVVVPVPAHWSRRWHRGGNVPDLLAEAVARRVRRPMAAELLRCRRKTRKQGTLLPTERTSNVRGAFAVSRSYDLQKAHVLVVDDVMTTGATASEIARTLLRAGAANVAFAAVARGIGFD